MFDKNENNVLIVLFGRGPKIEKIKVRLHFMTKKYNDRNFIRAWVLLLQVHMAITYSLEYGPIG